MAPRTTLYKNIKKFANGKNGRRPLFVLFMKFILKSTAPDRFATCSISLGISALNHEVLNDTMEYHTIIVAILTAPLRNQQIRKGMKTEASSLFTL
jgi:hypothetical protein